MLLTKLFTAKLKESKGNIVNVSCDKGSRPEAGTLAYCMSKAGLDMLTKTTALELAAYGVRVNGVAPCMIEESNMYKVTGYSQAEFERLKTRAKNNIPLQKLCCDEDAAKAIIFLSSEK